MKIHTLILKLFAFGFINSVYQSFSFSQLPIDNRWQMQLFVGGAKPIINNRSIQILSMSTVSLYSKSTGGLQLKLKRNFNQSKFAAGLAVARSYWGYAVGTIRDTTHVTCPLSELQLGLVRNIPLTKGYLSVGLGMQVVSYLKTQSEEYATWFNGFGSEVVYTRIKDKLGFSIGIAHSYMPIQKKYNRGFELYNDNYYRPVVTPFQSIGVQVGLSYFLK